VTRVPPPLIALAAAVGQRAISGPTPVPGPRRMVVAATVSLASVAMAGAAGNRFRRTGTTLDPFHPARASSLVTTGPNALTRNPMYVGLAGLLVAHTIWRGSPVTLAPVAAFVVLIDRLQITAEEAALVETFGPDYEAYRAATPRWLDGRSLTG
jgi:protein-S-isoprenylcysteine O-methyltransferase Ste14